MRISYLAKFLLLLLGLVLLLEAASYITTRHVIRDAVTENARTELMRGGDVFAQLMQSRAEQLALSVSVLSDDFGFRAAVASSDAPTIASALKNHSARIEADLSMVFSPQGSLIAVYPNAEITNAKALADLQQQALATGLAYTPMLIDGRPYQFVLASVRAPLLVGVAGMGFEIEENLTRSLKHLTGLEVSFVSRNNDSLEYLSGTLEPFEQQLLLADLQGQPRNIGEVWETREMMSLVVAVAPEQKDMAAVLQVPIEKVLAPFASLDAQLLWLALVFFLVAGLLAFLLARGVTRPVRSLAETAKSIGAGDYAQPVSVVGNDEMGDLAKAFVTMQTAIREREQKILFQAEHDSLTGLPNRSRVLPAMVMELKKAAQANEQLVLMVIDARNFTQINDELSTDIGDQVLQQIAQRILLLTRPEDQLLRLGSDEFLLLKRAREDQSLGDCVQAIHQLFFARLILGELSIKVELNIGVARYPVDGDHPDVLLRRANLALKQGRLQGHQTCVYQDGWDEHHLRRLQLLREFKPALASGQISVCYQPKVSLRTPQKLGAEALVRWQHPEFGFVNPDEFIALIESGGQIHSLTRWLVQQTLAFLSRQSPESPLKQLSINISAMDLLVDDFPEYVEQLLDEFAIKPQFLCLEITESAIMRETERSLQNLQRLRTMGLDLSIDDFGTGYSSLSQIKQLPVSELKIDKSFVLNLENSLGDQRIVSSTIDLGHTLGLSITAEGVETAGARDLLRSFNCDTLQGYFFSRPLTETDFTAWMKGYLETIKND